MYPVSSSSSLFAAKSGSSLGSSFPAGSSNDTDLIGYLNCLTNKMFLLSFIASIVTPPECSTTSLIDL